MSRPEIEALAAQTRESIAHLEAVTADRQKVYAAARADYESHSAALCKLQDVLTALEAEAAALKAAEPVGPWNSVFNPSLR
jgi:hypothetical protein